MTKLYYRGMAEENGQPKVGCSARLLGVRLGLDIDTEEIPRGWLDDQGYFRPAAFGGMGRDPLWQIEDSKITGDLEAVQDSATHVSLMPRVTMLLEKYEMALANTQNDWERVS
ncbi:MAG: hypothetical protein ACFCU9_07175 [Cyanophyceae cyanobacterium]